MEQVDIRLSNSSIFNRRELLGKYGGNQIDFLETNYKFKNRKYMTGCSAIAITNTLYHLYETNDNFKILDLKTNKEEYMKIANQIYEYMFPYIAGVFTLKQAEIGIRRFLKRNNMEEFKIDKFYRENKSEDNYLEAINFIEDSLKEDIPVLLLTGMERGSNPKHLGKINKNILKHWICITGIVRKENRTQIIFSSWGREMISDLEVLWKIDSFPKGGLLKLS